MLKISGWKKWTAVLALCMLMISLICIQAYGEESCEDEAEPTGEEAEYYEYIPEDLPDSEELFDGFAMRLLYGRSDQATYGVLARERLSEKSKKIYDVIKEGVIDLARGERSSAVLIVNAAESGCGTFSDYSYEELWLVLDALQHDCPYEMYMYRGCRARISSQRISVSIMIAAIYRPSNYDDDSPTIDTSKARATVNAANNAQAIVNMYASYSDYNKLAAYKDKICSLVEYDHYAADNDLYDTDIRAWTLINAFDGDPSTNIVCKGYAVAFQYLCDLSDFTGNVECYSALGDVYFYDGSDGYHQWNIVRINGISYFADITACDSYGSGRDREVFMSGGSGSAGTNYRISTSTYIYDDGTKSMWGTGPDSVLTLSATAYNPSSPPTPTPTPIYEISVGSYNVSISAGSSIKLSFSAPASGEYRFYSTGDYDTRCYLYDENMEQLAYNDDDGDGYNFSISYSLSAGQKVYLILSFYNSNTSGTFGLIAEAPTTPTPTPTPEPIYDIAVGSYDVSISAGSSIKLSFSAPASGEYRFYSTGDYDTRCYLYDENMEQLAYNDDSGEGNNFNIYYGLTAGQKVYIVLDFYDSDASGSFTLTVEAPAEPTPTPAATPIPVLAVGVNSVYVPADQMVRMSFVAPFSGEYAFYTTGDQDTEGYLYDADMNLLASDDDGGDLYNFSISYNLNAGQKVYAGVCFYLLSESGTVSLVVEAPTPGPDTVIASGYYYDGNAGKTDITWTIKGDGSLTLSGNGEVEYEGELKGLDDYRSMVTSVEAGTGITVAAGFDHMVNLQTVNLPNVIMIDMRAFQGCTSLESVNAPNAKRISEEAFEDCTGLSNLNIDKIEEIGEEAFKNCISLTNMYLLDTISIYREAFSGCNLSLLQISASLETIGAYNFDTHSNLLTIYGGTPEQWASVTVHEGNSKLEHDFFFLGPKFILPAGLKEISEEAFANASMTFVVCPNEMERIGSRAFMNNRQPLAIEIPATVFEIADDAFEGCEDLMIVTGFDTYACRWAKDRGIWVVGY